MLWQTGGGGLLPREIIGRLLAVALNWLQPHEGSIVDFLFKARAYQTPDERLQRLCNGG